MHRIWIFLGALAGLSGVTMAAAGAWIWQALGPAASGLVQTATQMQMSHALALLFCGLSAERTGRGHWAAASFALGILVFCGGLYLRAFEFPRLLGISPQGIIPIGGALLMLGWTLLAISALRPRWPRRK
ncbi:MAG: DUF423 domain-containing protein [Acetobacteraceae bacterium]|nr:DUF423 domain-containing protein [Acetobacteraceae bacterium]